MKASDLLSLSLRMFKTRPLRTFLTVLGVGIGIAAVLFLVSLGYGLQQVILNRIATADTLLALDVNAGPGGAVLLDAARIAEIRAMPHVTEVSRQKNFPAQASINDLTGNLQLSGIDPSFQRLKGLRLTHGEELQPGDATGALISSAAIRLFNLQAEDIIGRPMEVSLLLPREGGVSGEIDSVTVDHSFRIAGVVDDDQISTVYLPLEGLGAVSIDVVDQLKVKVESSAYTQETRDALIAQGLVVSALSDIIEQASKIFRIVQIVLALFGLVALVVSAIGMFNTMTIALLERTNEIGIMRAIGITKTDVCKLFLLESMLMGFLGGLGGVLMGVAAGSLTNIGVNMLAVRFGGSAIDLFYVPGWFVTVIIVFSTCIGFLTGLYPSLRASRLNPLDALRYK
jgi:putative ABC transport system permease protein